jgi:hypothetical protein
MPRSRYHIPKNARHAAFCHMSDYSLEIRSSDGLRSSLASCMLCSMRIEENSMVMLTLTCNLK